MLIFINERLALLSVPKTGSTAWETALRDRADIVVSNPPELKHAPLYRFDRFFRPMFEKICNARMETLAVMRQPVDWLGSWYRYRRRDSLVGHPNSTQGLSFDNFVRDSLKGHPPAHANVGRQSRFLAPRPGADPVTHLFRYEDQKRLAAFLRGRLGDLPEPERLNTSPRMNLTLAPGVEKRLRRKWSEDFELYDSIR